MGNTLRQNKKFNDFDLHPDFVRCKCWKRATYRASAMIPADLCYNESIEISKIEDHCDLPSKKKHILIKMRPYYHSRICHEDFDIINFVSCDYCVSSEEKSRFYHVKKGWKETSNYINEYERVQW